MKFAVVAAILTCCCSNLVLKERRWVVAVARRLNGDGFLITAYQTDAIKEGETLWHK